MTLAEVEAAARRLTEDEQRQLVHTLVDELAGVPAAQAPPGLRDDVEPYSTEAFMRMTHDELVEAIRTLPPLTPEQIKEGQEGLARMRAKYKLTKFEDPDGPAAAPEEWKAVREHLAEKNAGTTE